MQKSFKSGLSLRASKPIVPLPEPISQRTPFKGNSRSAKIWILISLFVIRLGLSSNVLKRESFNPNKG